MGHGIVLLSRILISSAIIIICVSAKIIEPINIKVTEEIYVPTTETNCVPTRETFIVCVGAMIKEENEAIEVSRARVIAAGEGPDVPWLSEQMSRYNAKTQTELLRRMNIIPLEMAIAQSILESGWGTSYAARIGKGLFGQIQASGLHDVSVPWQPGPDRPQPFKDHRQSVKAYFFNINTHPAYAGFREAREKNKDPIVLMNYMTRYSIRGQAYIKDIQGIIKSLQK